MKWTTHPRIPEFEFAPSLGGGYWVRRNFTDGRTETVEVESLKQLEKVVSEASRSEKHLPLGDYIAKVTRALHIPACMSCEARRQLMNRLIKRKKR